MKDITISIEGERAAKEKKENLVLQKKLKKIDLLKLQLKRVKERVLKYQKAYNKEIEPEAIKLNAIREQYVIVLHSKLKQKSFSQYQHQHIRELIIEEIEDLNSIGYTSSVLTEINNNLFDMGVDNLSEDEEDLMIDMIKEMARNQGFDVDDDTFDFKEFVASLDEHANRAHQEEHKSFQEAQKKEKIKHTDKDFYKIYKNLAKKHIQTL